MQTTGTTLLVAELRSLARVQMAAQDSRSAHGLLYLAAVQSVVATPKTAVSSDCRFPHAVRPRYQQVHQADQRAADAGDHQKRRPQASDGQRR